MKIMNTEAQMRDYIANNLTLVEAGLELVKTEYKLKNSDSIYGYIDILAKDRFGNLVIIELKKSKNSARQAVHEFHKYVGLIKQVYRVQESKIRCVLLSTEWSELLLPFSNFVYETPNYQMEGYRVVTNSSGVPQKCEQVPAIRKETFSGAISVCPYHKIHLYEDESGKDRAELVLMKTLDGIGSSFLVFSIVYRGGSPNVIQPFGHYVVPLAIDPETRRSLQERLDWQFDEETSDAEAWSFEQEVLSYIGEQVFPYTTANEIGYAEKLDSILSAGWIIEKTHRFGQELCSEEIYPQDVLVKAVKGHEGTNTRVYHAKSSPRFNKRWREIKEELRYPLIGNEVWQEIVDLYLSEIEVLNPEEDVSITIFNPTNTIITLMKAFESDSRYFPMLEIAIEEKHTKNARVLLSQIHWNGRVIRQTPERLIDGIFESLNGFFAQMHFGGTYEQEHLVLFEHGLFYDFAELYVENERLTEVKRVTVEENRLLRNVKPTEKIYSFEQFVENNQQYLQALHTYISYSSHGL